MATNLQKNPPAAKPIRIILWAIVGVLIIVIGLCWAFYAETYRFFKMTISDLGMYNTITYGNINTTSRWIFTIGFLVIAVLLLTIFILYAKNTGFYAKTLKMVLIGIFILGAIGTACPYDSKHHFHGIGGEILTVMHFVGAAFFVGGYAAYNFVCQLLRYIRRKKQGKYPTRNFNYWLDLILVYLVIITAAWYLLSGVFGLFGVDKSSGFFWLFPTALSQKCVLFASTAAAFATDKNDI